MKRRDEFSGLIYGMHRSIRSQLDRLSREVRGLKSAAPPRSSRAFAGSPAPPRRRGGRGKRSPPLLWSAYLACMALLGLFLYSLVTERWHRAPPDEAKTSSQRRVSAPASRETPARPAPEPMPGFSPTRPPRAAR